MCESLTGGVRKGTDGEMLALDRALIVRAELAEADFQGEFGLSVAKSDPGFGAGAKRFGEAWAVDKGPDGLFSRCFGMGLNGVDGVVTAGEIERIEAWYAERGKAAAFDLSPLADASLARELSQRGYRHGHFDTVLLRLVRDDDGEFEVPRGMEIRVADDGDTWAAHVSAAFQDGGPAEDQHPCMERKFRGFFDQPSSVCLEALIGGEVAGVAMMACHRGVCLLHAAGTLTAFRGRGVQRALLGARAKLAREAGCDLLASQTDPKNMASLGNMMRFGMEIVYTRPGMVGFSRNTAT